LYYSHTCSSRHRGAGQRRQDFEPDELQEGKVLYVEQTDNLSGNGIFKMRIAKASADRIVSDVENVTSIRYFLVTLFPLVRCNPSILWIVNPDGVWRYYSMARTGRNASRLTAGHESLRSTAPWHSIAPWAESPPTRNIQPHANRAGVGQTIAVRHLPVAMNFHLSPIVVSIVIPIVVAVAVPAVVVAKLAVFSIPISFIILLSVITGFHPARARVCRAGPVTVVPLIVIAHRVPITGDPGIAGTGTARLNPDHSHRRRRADSHSDGKLRERRSHREQRQRNQFCFHDFLPLLSMMQYIRSTLTAEV
jgi:hypothetical protein